MKHILVILSSTQLKYSDDLGLYFVVDRFTMEGLLRIFDIAACHKYTGPEVSIHQLERCTSSSLQCRQRHSHSSFSDVSMRTKRDSTRKHGSALF